MVSLEAAGLRTRRLLKRRPGAPLLRSALLFFVSSHISDLAPINGAITSRREDGRARLDANAFRQAALGILKPAEHPPWATAPCLPRCARQRTAQAVGACKPRPAT
jgi:hypothetical protein